MSIRELPSRPNIEHFKSQARTLLQQVLSSDAFAADGLRHLVQPRLNQRSLLADGFVVNFFARHEKGVKTEYIDPVVTMQLLGLVGMSTTPVKPGVHKIDSCLRPEI